MVEICAVGGYSEVGKNMTSVKVGNDVMILDAGIYLPAVVEFQEAEKDLRGEQSQPTSKKMRSIGALPDDLILDQLGWRNKVRALLIGHAHLDHVGAVPYIAERYNADIVGTPFTMEVLKQLMFDNDQRIKNQIKTIHPNSSYTVRGEKNYQVEFLNITHSTPQTATIAIHTPQGAIVYSSDYKLDNTPVM